MTNYRGLTRALFVLAALGLVPGLGEIGRAQSSKTTINLQKTITDAAGRQHTVQRKVTGAERKAAAGSLKAKTADAPAAALPLSTVVSTGSLAGTEALPLPEGAVVPTEYHADINGVLVPDYSGVVPNYANSPVPLGTCSVTTTRMCTGATLEGVFGSCPQGETCVFQTAGPGAPSDPNGGIRKFKDTLAGLGPGGANNLGNFIPIAVPDTVTYRCENMTDPAPNCLDADYYEIELGEFSQKLHTDLPPTRLRGYRQTNFGTDAGGQNTIAPSPGFQYLGPLIVARKGRPVRVKFTNNLAVGEGGRLFIPVDTTVMGAGAGHTVADGTRMTRQGQLCVGVDCYPENRATIHLHGGVTPWISDGTTHQWITPASEQTPYPTGVSVFNVPDMPNPGKPPGGSSDGVQTFYYTNDQAARLMFYHDHAHGITRLNVYVGEAAGYLLTDAAEQALVDSGALPADQIPLILQDKSFVDPRTIAYQDPTWNWGTGAVDPATGRKLPAAGDLWWPHVYQPAQNPYDITGVNAMGRWVYGLWFWPPTATIPFKDVSNPYYDCDAAGLPIWPAEACREWQPPTVPGTPNPSVTAEAFLDTPVINGTAYPVLTVEPKAYRFRLLDAAHDRFFNLSLHVAVDADGRPCDAQNANPAREQSGVACTEVALNAAEVAASKEDPFGVFPTPDLSRSAPGPSWLYVGTEGGFLPTPVEVRAQHITWVTDPTVFNAGNVKDHSLLLAPAERADVVVDFSNFAGYTLILYNDAPAAFPARDPRFDYFTDSADLTDTGGLAPVRRGYGPNTRTMMQIKVSGGTPAPAVTLAALKAAFAGVFAGAQDPIIVGQPAYDEAYGTNFPSRYPCWGIARIQDTSMCVANVDGSRTVEVPLEPKAIHDEMGASFDDYGRMSTNLGVELRNTSTQNQLFVLQSYSDPPTELVKLSDVGAATGGSFADGTQIWKITHNGVDTHPVHFHLFHVQLVNRVGWDGGIRLPHPTELGWKDTVRVSPLEDTVVALRPISPRPDILPWKLPNSIRPLEPALPHDTRLGFTNIGPDGQAFPIFNEPTNFGWEYIWHCHILSHEEHDMMRAVGFAMPPEAPVGLEASVEGEVVTLQWRNPSLVATGFTIERATDLGFTQNVTVAGRVDGDTTRFNEQLGAAEVYYYRVFASNVIGSTQGSYPQLEARSGYSNVAASSDLPQPNASVSPVRLYFPLQDVGSTSAAQQVTLANAGLGALSVAGIATTGDFAQTNDCGASVAGGASCTINVTFTPQSHAVSTGALTITAANAPPLEVSLGGSAVTAPPSGLTAVLAGTGAALSWNDNSAAETGFTIERATDSAFAASVVAFATAANLTTYLDAGLVAGTTYWYRVRADSAVPSDWSNVASVQPAVPARPTNLSAGAITATTIALSWIDNATNETTYEMQRATNNSFTQNAITVSLPADSVSYTLTGLAARTRYYVRVRALNGFGASQWSPTVSATTTK